MEECQYATEENSKAKSINHIVLVWFNEGMSQAEIDEVILEAIMLQ